MARKRRGRAQNAAADQPQQPPRPAPPSPQPTNASTKSETPSGSKSGPARATRKSAPVVPEPIASQAAPSPKPVSKPARPPPGSSRPDTSSADADTPSLISAVRDALEALETGCVSEAYLALSRALPGSDNPEPDKQMLEKIDKVTMLITGAKITARKGGDADSVLNDVDEAEALWTEFGNSLRPPKKIETHMAVRQLRVAAHFRLGEYEMALEETGIMKAQAEAKGVIYTGTLTARMNAFFHLGRLAEAAQAAWYYLGFPDTLASQTLAADTLQVAEEKNKGDDAYKNGQWDRAITAYTKAANILVDHCHSRQLIASLYYNLGMAHLKLNRVSRAHEHFTTALDFSCSHIKALRNRAVASERLGYIHDAASDLRRARMYLGWEKDPKLYEYLKKESDRVEDLGDEQERKRQEAYVEIMRGPPKEQHYHTLGLKVGANEVEIKSAFKTLALQHHPDKGGNAEKFKEVRSAYEALLGTGTGDIDVSDCAIS